jgi:hypothetical protein
MDERAPPLIEKVLAEAEAGDPEARKLIWKLLPSPLRYVGNRFAFGPLTDAASALRCIAKVGQMVSAGRLDIASAEFFCGLADRFLKHYQAEKIEADIEAIRRMQRGEDR